MPIVAKKKKIDNNTEIENTSVNFNTLNYPEKSVNTYDTDDKSEWERDFPHILAIMTHRALTFTLELFFQYRSI